MITIRPNSGGGFFGEWDAPVGRSISCQQLDSVQTCMVYVLEWLRTQDVKSLKYNLQTFEDWTAIAAVMGATYANRVFADHTGGEP